MDLRAENLRLLPKHPFDSPRTGSAGHVADRQSNELTCFFEPGPPNVFEVGEVSDVAMPGAKTTRSAFLTNASYAPLTPQNQARIRALLHEVLRRRATCSCGSGSQPQKKSRTR